MKYQVGQLYNHNLSNARKFIYIYQIDNQIHYFYGFFDKRVYPQSEVHIAIDEMEEFNDMMRNYKIVTMS
jgi:hypothetical protein